MTQILNINALNMFAQPSNFSRFLNQHRDKRHHEILQFYWFNYDVVIVQALHYEPPAITGVT